MTEYLHDVLRRFEGRTAIVWGEQAFSYENLASTAESISQRLNLFKDERVNILASDVASLVVGIAALSKSEAMELAILPPDIPSVHKLRSHDSTLVIMKAGNQWEFKRHSSSEVRPHEKFSATQIALFTSGTSGVPREVHHNWSSLTRAIRRRPAELQRRWSCGFAFGTFAQLQVVLQALLAGDCYYEPVVSSPHLMAEYFKMMGVEFCAATTSFWRQLLRLDGRKSLSLWPLRQVTISGEVVDQFLFDEMRNVFPQAKITQIYATTELGVCFSVNDHQVGFPRAYLQNQLAMCMLRIGTKGTLEIKLHCHQQEIGADCHRDQWVDTGDLVRIDGDRVYFVGRQSEMINVGGTKVSPSDVEQLVRRINGVADVCVEAMPSSLLGSLVCASILPSVEDDKLAQLRDEILRVCRRELPKSAVPAKIVFVAELPQTRARKAARSYSQETTS